MKNNSHKKGCVCCTSPDKHQAMIQEAIDKIGFAVIPVTGQDPHVAYTVGLTETLGCPELFATHAMDVIDLAKVLREAGLNLIDSCKGKSKAWIKKLFEKTDVPCMMKLLTKSGPKFAWTGCRPITDPKFLQQLGMADRRYNGAFKAVQIIMPDTKGKLPWHVGFDTAWGMNAAQLPLYNLTDLDKKCISIDECRVCKMSLPGLGKCGRCGVVRYCSEACQKLDWPEHKLNCPSKVE